MKKLVDNLPAIIATLGITAGLIISCGTSQTTTEQVEIIENNTPENLSRFVEIQPFYFDGIVKKHLSYREARKEAIDIIKKYEGFSSTVYTCPAGKRTLGYGLTGHYIKNRESITQSQAEQELKYIYDDIHTNIKSKLHRKLPENMMAALVSFAFNVGENALYNSTLFKLILDDNYDEVENEFSRYVYSNGKVLKGLELRRNAESALFTS